MGHGSLEVVSRPFLRMRMGSRWLDVLADHLPPHVILGMESYGGFYWKRYHWLVNTVHSLLLDVLEAEGVWTRRSLTAFHRDKIRIQDSGISPLKLQICIFIYA